MDGDGGVERLQMLDTIPTSENELQRMIFIPGKRVFASARQDIGIWGTLSSQKESYISSHHRTEGPVQTDKGDTLQL